MKIIHIPIDIKMIFINWFFREKFKNATLEELVEGF